MQLVLVRDYLNYLRVSHVSKNTTLLEALVFVTGIKWNKTMSRNPELSYHGSVVIFAKRGTIKIV
jgi:hypothetical protein